MKRKHRTQTHRYPQLPVGISFQQAPPRYIVYLTKNETDGRKYHVTSTKTLDSAKTVRNYVTYFIKLFTGPDREFHLLTFGVLNNREASKYEYRGRTYKTVYEMIVAMGRDYYKTHFERDEKGISDGDVVRPDTYVVKRAAVAGTESLPVDDTPAPATGSDVAGGGLWELTDRLETIITEIRAQLDTTPAPARLDAVQRDGATVWETGHTIYEIERIGSDTHVITRDTGTVEAREGLIHYDATATSPCTPESARRLAAGLAAAAAYIEQGRE